MTKTKDKEQRVGDVVTSGFEDFYTEAERVEIGAVMEMGDVRILDCRIVENFETEFGEHDLAVIAIQTLGSGSDETVFTFPTSGVVIIRKMRDLISRGLFPIIGRFNREQRYYDVK